MNYTDRVARGAAELDRILPGWERKIDLDKLQLYSECNCVLGQLAVDLTQTSIGPCDYRRYKLALDQIEPHDDPDWVDDHGFDIDPEHDTTNAYIDLTEAWKRLIRQRLEEARTRLNWRN